MPKLIQRIKRQIWQITVALDQTANTFPFMGWADETISARCWRQRHKPFWGKMRVFVDAIFRLVEKDHCYLAFDNEKNGKHRPKEYRPSGM